MDPKVVACPHCGEANPSYVAYISYPRAEDQKRGEDEKAKRYFWKKWRVGIFFGLAICCLISFRVNVPDLNHPGVAQCSLFLFMVFLIIGCIQLVMD